MQTRRGVDLRRGDPLVSEKLLHLVEGHTSPLRTIRAHAERRISANRSQGCTCVQQDCRHAGAKTVGSDVPVDTSASGCIMH